MTESEKAKTGKKHRRAVSDEQIISAVMECRGNGRAAHRLGISVRTLTRRMADQEFQPKLQAANRRLVRKTTDTLTANSGQAADVLRSIFADREASYGSRVQAATQTIRLTLEAFELVELEERITRLETQQQQNEKF